MSNTEQQQKRQQQIDEQHAEAQTAHLLRNFSSRSEIQDYRHAIVKAFLFTIEWARRPTLLAAALGAPEQVTPFSVKATARYHSHIDWAIACVSAFAPKPVALDLHNRLMTLIQSVWEDAVTETEKKYSLEDKSNPDEPAPAPESNPEKPEPKTVRNTTGKSAIHDDGVHETFIINYGNGAKCVTRSEYLLFEILQILNKQGKDQRDR